MRVILFAFALSTLAFNSWGADLRVYRSTQLPHAESYALFVDASNDAKFYYLPLRIEQETDPANGAARFSFMYSGYKQAANSLESAALIVTFRFTVISSELADIKEYLEKQTGHTGILFAPIPAVKYRIDLRTNAQRLANKPMEEISEGTTTIDSSLALNLSLESLHATEAFDLLNDDQSLGGIVISVAVEALDEQDVLSFVPATLIPEFLKIGKWSASNGLETLGDKLAESQHYDTRQQREIFRAWLKNVLPGPDLLRFDDGVIRVGWDLADPALRTAVQNSQPVRVNLGTVSKITWLYYSSFVFKGYCSKFKSQILDLDSGHNGCISR